MKNVCSKLIHKNQTVNLKNVGAIPAAPTKKTHAFVWVFYLCQIFIVKYNIMARAKKRPAAKPNRGNVVKRKKILKQNEEIISRLK